ncbi:hypothetical protein SAY87_021912 [Trapa incisa]|uniref:Uncharacterized protein n=1 Tax=Trapa incisa TaxID=236973 RepID=A0AAN7JSJ8_9MYRT|nr:hypothetical protein SAY87_021912 [Trapa incisa]
MTEASRLNLEDEGARHQNMPPSSITSDYPSGEPRLSEMIGEGPLSYSKNWSKNLYLYSHVFELLRRALKGISMMKEVPRSKPRRQPDYAAHCFFTAVAIVLLGLSSHTAHAQNQNQPTTDPDEGAT